MTTQDAHRSPEPTADGQQRAAPARHGPRSSQLSTAGRGHAGTAKLARRAAAWLAAGAIYLALSIAVWWHVWTGHPSSAMTCACGDP
ncbi:MAG: hypothetical protein J2P34_04875, partial [Actinobacteria bacterium]|nr:hypothetical protein [Actinomycetota bacterium]